MLCALINYIGEWAAHYRPTTHTHRQTTTRRDA